MQHILYNIKKQFVEYLQLQRLVVVSSTPSPRPMNVNRNNLCRREDWYIILKWLCFGFRLVEVGILSGWSILLKRVFVAVRIGIQFVGAPRSSLMPPRGLVDSMVRAWKKRLGMLQLLTVWLVACMCKQTVNLSERECRNAPLDYVSTYSHARCRSVPVQSWDMSGGRDQIENIHQIHIKFTKQKKVFSQGGAYY